MFIDVGDKKCCWQKLDYMLLPRCDFWSLVKNYNKLNFIKWPRDGACIETIGIDLNRKEFSPNEDFDFLRFYKTSKS